MSFYHKKNVKQFFAKLQKQNIIPSDPNIQFCESHYGWVALCQNKAYKVRKPIFEKGLVDYSTPRKRLYFLKKELRLGKAMTPELYLDVLPLYKSQNKWTTQKTGPVQEAVLIMKQLPQQSLLSFYLDNKIPLKKSALTKLIQTLIDFQKHCPKTTPNQYVGPSEMKRWVYEFYGSDLPIHQKTMHFDFVNNSLKLSPIFKERFAKGMARDGHGDFRADNIFYYKNNFYPFDRIEFKDEFRRRDVIVDIATLLVEFLAYNRLSEAKVLHNEYKASKFGYKMDLILPAFMHYKALVLSMVNKELAKNNKGKIRSLYLKKHKQFYKVACDVIQKSRLPFEFRNRNI